MNEAYVQKMNQQAMFWNAKAAIYTNPWEKEGAEGNTQQQRILSLLTKYGVFTPTDKRILDVGCGKGTLLPFMKHLAPQAQIIELDISQTMLSFAGENSRRLGMEQQVSYLQAFGDDTNLPESSFDKVVVFNAFPHFEDKAAALAEWSRLLQTGGTINIIHSMSSEHLNAMHAKKGFDVQKEVVPSIHALQDMATQHGLLLSLYVDNTDEDFVAIQLKKII